MALHFRVYRNEETLPLVKQIFDELNLALFCPREYCCDIYVIIAATCVNTLGWNIERVKKQTESHSRQGNSHQVLRWRWKTLWCWMDLPAVPLELGAMRLLSITRLKYQCIILRSTTLLRTMWWAEAKRICNVHYNRLSERNPGCQK